ncbi:MAG: MazG family protein, partial [Oscillospiraceae bacterium]
MIDFKSKNSYGINDLTEIVRLLRGEGGCPWDRVQTHESIRRNFLEESYEVVEAIDEKNPAHLQEELGDVLLQVVFHSLMEEEVGHFNLDDVADGICKKLIFRHPHVFSDVSVKDADEVLVNWEALKREEKSQDTYADSVDAVA